MTENTSPSKPDAAREGQASPTGAVASQPSGPRAKTAPSGQRKLLNWLVLCLTVAALGWILYRAPLAREMTVRCAAKLGPRSVPLLRRALGDEDPGVKRAAGETLTDLGAAAVPGLSESLKDPNPLVRSQAAFGLAILGRQGKEAVAALLPVTEDANPKVRRQAIMALCAVSAYGEVARPVARKALQDPDPEVRAFAGEAMGRFGRQIPKADDGPSGAGQGTPPTNSEEAADTRAAETPTGSAQDAESR